MSQVDAKKRQSLFIQAKKSQLPVMYAEALLPEKKTWIQSSVWQWYCYSFENSCLWIPGRSLAWVYLVIVWQGPQLSYLVMTHSIQNVEAKGKLFPKFQLRARVFDILFLSLLCFVCSGAAPPAFQSVWLFVMSAAYRYANCGNASSGVNKTCDCVCLEGKVWACEKGAGVATDSVNVSCLRGRMVSVYFQLHVQNVILTNFLCYVCHAANYLWHSPLLNL